MSLCKSQSQERILDIVVRLCLLCYQLKHKQNFSSLIITFKYDTNAQTDNFMTSIIFIIS